MSYLGESKIKRNNIITKIFSYVVLIFVFFFVGMVNDNENVSALPTCSYSVNNGSYAVEYSNYTETTSYISVRYVVKQCKNKQGYGWIGLNGSSAKFYYAMGTYNSSSPESGSSPTVSGMPSSGYIYLYRSTSSQVTAGGVVMDGICGRFKEWYDTRGYGGSFKLYLYVSWGSGTMVSNTYSTNSQYFYPITLTASPTSTSWRKTQTVSISASTVHSIAKIFTYDSMYSTSYYSWYYDASSATVTTNGSDYTMTASCSGKSSCSRSASSTTGTHYISIVAIDSKGNAATKTVTAKVDNTIPYLNSYYNSGTTGVTYKLSSSHYAYASSFGDNHSGVWSDYAYFCLDSSSSLSTADDLYYGDCSYKIDMSTSTKYFPSGIPSGLYYLYYYIEDNAGNYTGGKSGKYFYVDNTAPTLSSATANSTYYSRYKSASVSYSDSHSGVSRIYYCWNKGSSCTPSTYTSSSSLSTSKSCSSSADTGIWYLSFYGKDAVGNVSSTTSRYFYLDCTNPYLDYHTVYPNTEEWFNIDDTSLEVYLEAYDDHSGVDYNFYTKACISEYPNLDEVDINDGYCYSEYYYTYEGDYAYFSGLDSGYWYLYFYIEDLAGNGISYYVGEIWVDNEAPDNPQPNPYSNSSYVKSVTVNMSTQDYHSGVDYYYYCWTTSSSSCTSSWSYNYSDSMSTTQSGVTGTYYLRAYVYDNASNYYFVNAGPYYLDNTAPTLSSRTSNGNTNWAKSYTVTATYSDAHTSVGAVEYCWNTSSTASTVSSCASTSSTISGVTGYYYLHTRARDTTPKGTASSDYNWSGWSVTSAYYLDNTAPVFSSFSPNGDTTWRQSRSISITFTDAHSGVKKIYYCWATSSSGCTPSSGSTSTGTLSISKDSVTGYYYLSAKAEDNVGNVSGVTTSSAYYFDNTDPANPTFTASDTTWRQSKTVTMTSSDSHSGVDGFYYCTTTSSSGCTPGTWANASSGSASITLSSSGKWYVSAYAIDDAGNTSSTTTSGVYWIDSTAPSLSSINPNGNSTYKKSQSTVVTYTDSHSGVNNIQYCWSSSSSASSCSTYTTVANGSTITKSDGTGLYYLLVRAYDKSTSNNYSGWTRSNAFYLDNTAASFSSRTPSGETTYTKSKGITVVYSDGHSGVASIKYCWTTSSSGCTPGTVASSNSTSATINKTDGTGTYYLSTLAVDKAGNTSGTTTSTAYYFDNTAPGSPSYSPNGGTWSKSFTVTVSYTDGHSGVGAIEYCWNTSSTASTVSSCASTSNSLSGVSGTYYLHTRARDKATKGTGGTTSDYNWSGWSVSSAYYFDNTTPTGPTYSPNGNTTWAKSHAVTVTYGDAHSGVGAIEYCWNTSNTASTVSSCASTSSTISGVTGYYYLHTRARDKSLTSNAASGSNNYNYTGWSVTGAFYVDNTAPSFSSFSPNGQSSWVKQITVRVTYTDGHSGVNNIKYCWTTNSSGCTPNNTVSTSGYIDVPSSTIAGIYYLSVNSTDKAGNTSANKTSNAYYLAVSQELNSAGTHVKYYHSVQLGLSGMTSGNTLKMLINSTSDLEGSCLTNTKTVTLNMNGKTMTCTKSSTPGITNSGTLTINGSGTLTSSDVGISNTGTLTITNGTITGATRGIYSNGGSVTINGGTITGTSNDGIHVTGSLRIAGGTIKGGDDGVQNGGTGTVTMTAGSVEGIAGMWNAAGGTLTISGGTIKGTSSSYGGLYNSSTLNLSGGTITGTYGISNAGTAAISGGTMSTLVNTGTVTLSGTAKVSGAGSNSSSLTMSAGTISGTLTNSAGTSTLNGGTIAAVSVTGGTVNVGGATVSGAVTVSANKNFNLTSGTIGSLTSSGIVTMSGGTISGNTVTNGSMTISGGTTSTISNGGGLTVKGTAKTGKITNLCVLVIEAGTVAGIYNRDNTSVAGVNGETTISGGTISVSSGIAIETTAGSVSISGGSVTGPTGISISGGTLTISGGTVTGSSSYAINASAGTVTYSGGTLKGSTGNIYTYYMASGVNLSIGDRSEYTYISGSQYITTLVTAVATIGSTNYNTLQAALNVGGTITLNKNVTDLYLTIPSGKTVTLNLNGKTLNSFITARVATTAGTTNFITNNGTLTVYGGTMQSYRNAVGIQNNGTLNYGRSSDSLSTSTPTMNTLNYAINNPAGKILNYNNGKLISKNQSNVISSQNKDLYMRNGHYMDFSATSPYSVNLVSGTILGSSMSATTSISGTTLKVVVNHTRSIAGTDESVKVWLRTGGSTGEYAMSCTSSGTVTTCTTTVTSSFAYLYNATYANELLVAYVDNEGSVVDRREILRRDLLIVPEFVGNDGYAVDRENVKVYDVDTGVELGYYTIISDGTKMIIDVGTLAVSQVNIGSTTALSNFLGPQYASILNNPVVGIDIDYNNVYYSTCHDPENGCVKFYDAKVVIRRANYVSNYPNADSYNLDNYTSKKIQVYDYKPLLSASSVTALSATTCELGSACSVTPLS